MHTAQDKPSLDPTQLVGMMAVKQPAPALSQYNLQPQLSHNSARHSAGGVNEAARNQIDGRRRERGKEGIHASTAKPRPADSRSRNEWDRDRDRHRDRGRHSRSGAAVVPLLWLSLLLYDWLAQGGGHESEVPKNPSIISEEGEHSGAAQFNNAGRQIPDMPPKLCSPPNRRCKD